jgi:mannose-6-phosphate isomerase-like protein (cupin superfamily)
MDAFNLHDLIGQLDTSRHDFKEFFSAQRLSLTVAFWPAGAVDDQEPHAEDEVYYVASGAGWLRVAEEELEVGPGTIAYVGAGVDHRFHSIVEDLEVVVFWSPPRHAGASRESMVPPPMERG